MSVNVAIVYNIRSLQLSSGLFAFGDGVRGVEAGSGFWSAKIIPLVSSYCISLTLISSR